jgi:chaperone modulatory protein CbpM
MNDLEFQLRLQIDVAVLDVWIEEGWLLPQAATGERQFRDADVARGQLILDLTRNMGVNDAGVDIVMDLIDQLHGVRGTMRRLLTAIEQQEEDIKRRLLGALDEIEGIDRLEPAPRAPGEHLIAIEARFSKIIKGWWADATDGVRSMMNGASLFAPSIPEAWRCEDYC